MGTKDAKKGGLRKSSRMMKYGPGKLVTGMHPDRRPVQIQLQVGGVALSSAVVTIRT